MFGCTFLFIFKCININDCVVSFIYKEFKLAGIETCFQNACHITLWCIDVPSQIFNIYYSFPVMNIFDSVLSYLYNSFIVSLAFTGSIPNGSLLPKIVHYIACKINCLYTPRSALDFQFRHLGFGHHVPSTLWTFSVQAQLRQRRYPIFISPQSVIAEIRK